MSGQVMRVFGARESTSAKPSLFSAPERPIDLVHLSRQTLGDRDLEIELLGLFERQAGQIMEQIGGSGDRRLRHDLAHTLKGSARAVGAGAVAACAQEYEDCLYSGLGEADLTASREALQRAVDAARAAVTELLADR